MGRRNTTTTSTSSASTYSGQSQSSLTNTSELKNNNNTSYEVRPDKVNLDKIDELFKKEGKLIYDNTLKVLKYWNGAQWISATSTSGGGSGGVTYERATSYSTLTNGGSVGDLAFVDSSEGTQWLPGSVGGSYYSSGWYLWNGTDWVSDKNAIANQFETNINSLNTKVDIVSGKGLSTNDLTNSLKTTYDANTTWRTTNGDNLINHLGDTSNPHSVTKAQVGLDNVDNTSDLDKPLSTAMISALASNDTQLSDADITALGYVKTDNDTQLSDADIAALGYVKTSGTSISFFQVQDDGTTGQVVTSGYQNVQGLWDTPSITNSDFTFDATLGHLTTNVAGIIEIDTQMLAYGTLNDRVQLMVELQKNGTTLVSDSNYATRNFTQRTGSVSIHGFKDSCSIGDIYKIRVKVVGVSVTLGSVDAALGSYFSAKLYK